MTEKDCRPVLAVASSCDLGPQLTNNDHRMVGQDGAYSIPLASGRSLWYFGDTLIGERPKCSLHAIFRNVVDGRVETGSGPFERMITNTGLVLPKQTGASGLTDFSYILDGDGNLKKLVPSLPGEDPELQRVWCMHGVELEDRVYLSYMMILMHETLPDPDEMGFEVLGSGIAVGGVGDWEFRRLGGGKRWPPYDDTIWWSVREPQFGAAILHDESTGYVYFFGSLQDGLQTVQQAYLARVRPDEIEVLDRFEYFGGDGWVRHIGTAVPLFSGQPNEMSVSFNAHLDQYLAVHSWSLTGDVVGRTAPALWGPWSDPVVLWTVPECERAVPSGEPAKSFYAGKEHPSLAADGGRILYLTYVDSYEYYPHLIEVTLR